jgi:small subunit ribosomal protein S21
LAEVSLQEGEPLENALRRFKRKVQQQDVIKEVKRHSYYLKPGEKRRVKKALARKRNRKKARKGARLSMIRAVSLERSGLIEAVGSRGFIGTCLSGF